MRDAPLLRFAFPTSGSTLDLGLAAPLRLMRGTSVHFCNRTCGQQATPAPPLLLCHSKAPSQRTCEHLPCSAFTTLQVPAPTMEAGVHSLELDIPSCSGELQRVSVTYNVTKSTAPELCSSARFVDSACAAEEAQRAAVADGLPRRVLAAVLSDPGDASGRRSARSTWAQPALQLTVVFVLPRSALESLQAGVLRAESAEHGDLLFVDTPATRVPTLSALQAFGRGRVPSRPDFVLIAPFDMWVDMPRLLHRLSTAPLLRWAACASANPTAGPCALSADLVLNWPPGVVDFWSGLTAVGVQVQGLGNATAQCPVRVSEASGQASAMHGADDGSLEDATAAHCSMAASDDAKGALVQAMGVCKRAGSAAFHAAHAPCSSPHALQHTPNLSGLLGSHGLCVTGEGPGTLLTVFTTLTMPPPPHRTQQQHQKAAIHRNTIRALVALRPWVAVVVFVGDAHTAAALEDEGVAVVREGFRLSPMGIPYLKDMYGWVEEHSRAPMHGYMNADILFGPGLVDAVDVVLRSVMQGGLSSRLLLAGERHNVRMSSGLSPSHKHSLPLGAGLRATERLHASLAPHAWAWNPYGYDYFFITRGSWHWPSIPDFVPGRHFYDPWLVTHSHESGMVRVDSSTCSWAIHQTGVDGHRAWESPDRPMRDFNVDAARGYSGGGLSDALLETFTCALWCEGGAGASLSVQC